MTIDITNPPIETKNVELNTQAQPSGEAWNKAGNFFSLYPRAVKLPKARPNGVSQRQVYVEHSNLFPVFIDLAQLQQYSSAFSFIHIPDFKADDPQNKIFVMGPLLGEGSFGRVKKLYNKVGQELAVKLEGRTIRLADNPEKQVMQTLGYLVSELERPLPVEIQFKEEKTKTKLYTVTKFKKEINLVCFWVFLFKKII